ncbi:MAG: methionyl-tRNA formyltransferase [Candidatus Omnitrophica bacterium]|nr:methionyl-tRNA formyltransferase [Candidatus Omnitrophota bacterium]
MNIVFFGSSEFAVSSLKALLASSHKVACVVTQPDKQKGRGLHFTGTAIKAIALDAGINVYQPWDVNDSGSEKFLKGLNPDAFVVIAYGQILKQRILDIPKIFSMNLHASLLPSYRGAAPINWALIKGERVTGVTVIKMTEKMDAGPILLQKELEIDNDDTAITLEDKLSGLAAQLLLDALLSIERKNYKLNLQNEAGITFAPKLKKEDGRIDWNMPAQNIHNLVGGCINWPGAFTYYKGKLLKIYKAKASPKSESSVHFLSGEILGVSKEGIAVATGNDTLIIEELQIESKRRMLAEEFILGHKIHAGDVFDKK